MLFFILRSLLLRRWADAHLPMYEPKTVGPIYT